jgi:endo-1,3(4)-beta-glucanase
MYQREADGSDRATNTSKCWWAPPGTYYDEDWKGLPSRWADDPICGLDFGNSCYNDHHYHFGYYVVAAAILVDLVPSYKDDGAFVAFIDNFIRDTSNPSKADPYFPQFRTFDWFDMHSWSRGLRRNPDGKDQESTSEEVNLHYGVMLWGRVLGKRHMEHLGATMLTAASSGIRQYFLMKRDNPNYPAAFAKTHVTGIFFQAKVHRTTWFGGDFKYIHGIQMLPLTPAVPLSRSAEFAEEEWQDVLESLDNRMADPWTSILLSGGLAIFNPEEAFKRLSQIERDDFDDGLTKVWALWWAATMQEPSGVRPTPAPAPPPATTTPPAPPSPSPAVFCDPNSEPAQICPGQIPCPQCGAGACECPAV